MFNDTTNESGVVVIGTLVFNTVNNVVVIVDVFKANVLHVSIHIVGVSKLSTMIPSPHTYAMPLRHEAITSQIVFHSG